MLRDINDHQAKHEDAASKEPSFWRSRTGLVTIALLAIGGFLLLSEHRAHALGFLPFLLLLACPLMHLFMHGGHGGHDNHGPRGRN